ncbi:MAG: hypothetical protein RL026_1032 [Pseudomonadota bacterium]|jgi:hypothetical protein
MSARSLTTAVAVLLAASAGAATPEYATVRMSIDIDRPAAQVWAKVGKYCDIQDWLPLDCKITAGDGGMGTVRVLAGGRIAEIMVAQTALSYGYTQPAVEGRFYNLYHGFMEAVPLSGTRSRLLYTLVLDVSDKPDQAAKDADLARRRSSFEAALQKMKQIAEAP